MNNLETIGKRLLEYMKHIGVGLNKLGQMSGTSGSQIHNIMKGKIYGTDKLLNILKACPGLNVHWLLNGQGKMLNEAAVSRRINNSSEELQALLDQNAKIRLIKEKLLINKDRLEEIIAYMDNSIHAYKISIKAADFNNKELQSLIDTLKSA